MPELTIRPGHPDFLDLPWDQPLAGWETERIVDLPKGISRHEVRFVSYRQGIYAVKELSTRPAHQDYAVLRALEPIEVPSVLAVGLVERRSEDPTDEMSAALITRYVDHSFSYRELLAGAGFGANRDRMLDAFAGLLVQLHLAGCFWGDCSLSNVLYRYDGPSIETMLVDAETASLHEHLSDGKRAEDLEIMEVNVAGGMADIAAATGVDIDVADLELGVDISARYHGLWAELAREDIVGPEERYKIRERIERLNDLGFTVDEIDLIPSGDGSKLRIRTRVAGRSFHRDRLYELTGIEALESQAHQILSDLYYYQAKEHHHSDAGKAIGAIKWRVAQFEPYLAKLRATEGVGDPVQAYCDLLHHRYLESSAAGYDIGTEKAFASWLEAGRPGFDPAADA